MKSLLFFATLSLYLMVTLAVSQPPRQLTRWVEGNEVKDDEIYEYNGSYALVIGMTEYRYHQRLPGAKTDADEVAKVLKEHGFVVDVQYDLDSDNLESTIRNWVNKYGYEGKRRLLLYYAGHGHTMKVPDGRDPGYIVPTDAPDPAKNPVLFQQKAINMSTLRDYASKITTRHSLFVFDSCFSGVVNRSGGQSLPPVIQRALSNPARQFITAGTDGQGVPDVSLFREHFVAGLRGAADTERDGFITATELYRYLDTKVTNLTNSAQTPTYGKIENENMRFGDMVFPLTLNTAATSEDQAWAATQAKNSIADYNIFLSTYPNSKYKDAAYTGFRTASLKAVDEKRAAAANIGLVPTAPTVDIVFRSPAAVPKPIEFSTRETSSSGVLTPTVTLRRNAIVEELGDGVTMTLVDIPSGSFSMGGEHASQKPIRQVTVGGFFMGVHEVTRRQWQAVANMTKEKVDLPKDPSQSLSSEKLPKANITWEQAREFCERLARKTGRRYGLPSEAEWEYAARAGKTTVFAFGPKITVDLANFDAAVDSIDGMNGMSRKRPIEVGELGFANAWGLYDMHGNVAEWCEDGWIKNYDKAAPNSLPREANGIEKVIRGGSYKLGASSVCSACRAPAELADESIGFRVVMRSPVLSENP
ncbi:MAG: SUMF1/EgtB/PvdO family nonheme iron enzyme [Pyrinomonadaceae bacterium]